MDTKAPATNPASHIEEPLEWVLLPEGSVVHQNGVPIRLVTGALVSVARANMSMLVGHHVCAVPVAPVG